jgi:hypothetical protein
MTDHQARSIAAARRVLEGFEIIGPNEEGQRWLSLGRNGNRRSAINLGATGGIAGDLLSCLEADRRAALAEIGCDDAMTPEDFDARRAALKAEWERATESRYSFLPAWWWRPDLRAAEFEAHAREHGLGKADRPQARAA